MKSYVTLEVCPICGEDTGVILMDKRGRDSFEKRTINPAVTCNSCKEKYLKAGIMIINPYNGKLVVIKEEAFSRIFEKPIPKERIVFAKDEIIMRFKVEGGINGNTFR